MFFEQKVLEPLKMHLNPFLVVMDGYTVIVSTQDMILEKLNQYARFSGHHEKTPTNLHDFMRSVCSCCFYQTS